MDNMKIVTLILPHYLNRTERIYINEVIDHLLKLGHAIRFNGSGGDQNPLMHVNSEKVVIYPPYNGYYGLIQDIQSPTEQEKLNAYKIGLSVSPNMKEQDQKIQNMLLSSVYSIYGYRGNKSDLILILNKNSVVIHKHDAILYKKCIELAEESGVQVKYLTPR